MVARSASVTAPADPAATRADARAGAVPVRLLGLFFFSGAAALIYEVLWMKELGLLFGNAAQAAATTLAAFFLGLAAGGHVWGRRSDAVARPLRTYAWLEVGVALSALLYFLLTAVYQWLYPYLYAAFGGSHSAVFAAVKFALALLVLFPPAFFMGGTLPVMTRHVAASTAMLGRVGPVLYAVNTLGAAAGAYAAAFHLPPLLGFTGAYLVAVGLTLLVAATAWWWSRQVAVATEPAPAPRSAAAAAAAPLLTRSTAAALAFVSGLVTLSLQVLWTRMFAQVFQNSVYSFAAILVVFLLCLAIGGWLAAVLARRLAGSVTVLAALLILSALMIAATPFLFHGLTGMQYVGADADWSGYVMRMFAVVLAVLFLPILILGTVFPYLMKLSEGPGRHTGSVVGRLVACNTAGAIIGATAAGFVWLEWLGLWRSILAMALVYCIAAISLTPLFAPRWRTRLVTSAAVSGAAIALASLVGLPQVTVPDQPGREVVHRVWEGSAATVAVVERFDRVDGAGGAPELRSSLRIKVNNYYTLGGTHSKKWEQWQSHLPLLLHPAPAQVFYLGMGTGITAGAALDHPVDRVTVAELVPEAVTAARMFFGDHTNGLFDDPRVEVIADDGRNVLLGSAAQYDVIVADLFVPWKAGSGTLYSREHYAKARSRLQRAGLYAQWLPLYQMTEDEFGVIARTMTEVFPLVTLWRADFFSVGPAVLLLGHQSAAPLDTGALERRLRAAGGGQLGDQTLLHFVPDAQAATAGGPAASARFMLYYCGNLSAAGTLLARYRINTDDWPIIEYRAPIAERRQKAGSAQWFVGAALLDFFDRLFAAVPVGDDPYLRELSDRAQRFVVAGRDLYAVQVLEHAGRSREAVVPLRRFTNTLFMRGGG